MANLTRNYIKWQSASAPCGQTYRYFFWLYRVIFGIPAANPQAKGDSITLQTPSIEGTVMRLSKPDTKGTHPWKAEVSEGASGVTAETNFGWFRQVYEPTYTEAPAGGE